jgi:hypothetical protein
MILGTPFLEETNPDINWQKQTFTWRKENPLQELNHSSSRYTDINSIELNHIDLDIEINDKDNIDLNNFSVSDEIDEIVSIPMEINKVTTAMQLASTKVKMKTEIPKQFRKFSKVFDEQASLQFPPTRPYDHKIDLKTDFQPYRAKPYKLSPFEMMELKKFINENLSKKYIRPSESPNAAPFFFVGKKDGKLRPCQDYRYLNKHTIRNAYPIPMISQIMDKLKGAKHFTKFDVQLGYNNI